ncbi:hypothetical protein [Vallitalea sp.]|jgi:hypothetical protein|uniref:hypothetical protein n=1 Tax=Vallitalea sp. TaxID=1882829 RepID=UPI0025D84CEE|nr:hypothetical protein [Vallitalea sp.]MCT4686378.1 hypothetical protein [Vallitalea sp.]
MDKEYSARRYFIVGFRNYIENRNKILAKTYIPSMRELMYDYIDIYNDVHNSLDNDKWLKALKNSLTAIKYFLSFTILQSSDMYRKEIRYLITEIDDYANKKNNLCKIYNACTALIKKINNHNIYSEIIEAVKHKKTYNHIENALQLFIMELIYEGYSLEYLKEWYRHNINISDITTENIIEQLEKFKELKRNKKVFYYYVNVLKINQDEECFLANKFDAKKIDYTSLTFNDDKTLVKYIDNSNSHYLYKLQVYSMDVFKGLEILVESIESYYQINCFLENNQKLVVLEKVVAETDSINYIKMRIESKDKLFKGIEQREKADLQDFLKYRNEIIRQNIESNEIIVLQRALNIVKGQSNQSAENKLINLWSVLEYILTFHEGASIISKVCDIIPKLISLYVIKDKINTFWANLYRYNSLNQEIMNMIKECTKNGENYEYDLESFIDYLQKQGEKIIDLFEFNDLLKKEIAEIGLLLNDKEKRHKFIIQKNEEIENDLIRIYRTRNILIHSGQKVKINLNHKALRLYQYNNGLLGVIIYYKNKDININITEILNSINYTYTDYLKILQDRDSSPIDICKPRYIYL